jgi:uncharacterized protein with GYD domain
MPRFITFFSYTAEATKAMIERPSDRSAAAKALTESLGGTMEAFYWMHGHHDGFLITNLPDGVAAAALAGAVGATGAVGVSRHTRSLTTTSRPRSSRVLRPRAASTSRPPPDLLAKVHSAHLRLVIALSEVGVERGTSCPLRTNGWPSGGRTALSPLVWIGHGDGYVYQQTATGSGSRAPLPGEGRHGPPDRGARGPAPGLRSRAAGDSAPAGQPPRLTQSHRPSAPVVAAPVVLSFMST